MTFSVVSQAPDQGCYDSGVEDSETPSSKSSSGPRLGSLPLPEDGYERTTPEGSVGEEEHVENGKKAFCGKGLRPLVKNVHMLFFAALLL